MLKLKAHDARRTRSCVHWLQRQGDTNTAADSVTFCQPAHIVLKLTGVTVLALCCCQIIRWFSSPRRLAVWLWQPRERLGGKQEVPITLVQLCLLGVMEFNNKKEIFKRRQLSNGLWCECWKECCVPAPMRPGPAAPAAAAVSWGARPGAPLSRGPLPPTEPTQRQRGSGSSAGGRGHLRPVEKTRWWINQSINRSINQCIYLSIIFCEDTTAVTASWSGILMSSSLIFRPLFNWNDISIHVEFANFFFLAILWKIYFRHGGLVVSTFFYTARRHWGQLVVVEGLFLDQSSLNIMGSRKYLLFSP